MTPEERRSFLRDNHHAVLVTRKQDGGVQTSPVLCGLVGDDVVISTTQDRAKTKNLRRDPRAAVCVFTDAYFGRWVEVESIATIIDLPDALEGLRALYRQAAGEHPDWDEFDTAMAREDRCLVRLPLGS